MVIILILFSFYSLISLYLLYKVFRVISSSKPIESIQVLDTGIITRTISEQLKTLPEQITQSITGTGNTHKGKLGELIGYLQIKSQYDRIIPLGTIIDFLAIKFPDENTSGYIDLIDVKTGSAARLSSDQRKLKELIESKSFNFKTIKIDTIDNFNQQDD